MSQPESDPNEQANISGADFAIMCDHIKSLEFDQSAILKIIQCPAECEPPSMDQTVLVRGVASLVYRIRELEGRGK